jgi:hypothetical protein
MVLRCCFITLKNIVLTIFKLELACMPYTIGQRISNLNYTNKEDCTADYVLDIMTDLAIDLVHYFAIFNIVTFLMLTSWHL